VDFFANSKGAPRYTFAMYGGSCTSINLSIRRIRIHEMTGKFRKRCVTDHDEQRDATTNDGSKFVRRVADSLVMRDGNPAVLSAVLQPLFVRTVRRKEITVPFYGQPGINENLWKFLTEVAVGEVDKAHAARS
jgi:hypothetical protein